jgi:L-aspartate oxidase
MRTDFLIIGSGIAALRAAAALEGAGDVLILTKAEPDAGNTGFAQGGIAAAVGPDDSPGQHFDDTIAAGDGLCDERAVRVLVEEGPRYVRELLDWGARFDRRVDGSPELAIEGAHSVRRVLHAHDATGREIGQTLLRHVSAQANVRTHSHACATGVIVEQGRCAGVRYREDEGTVGEARARCTLLATGGAGRVYSQTTNPPVATGDGVAIAYDAGAAVADLEFVQFHPTALKVEGRPRFLLSEALRGEGGRLVNASGEAFMPRYDPMGDLAPRDRVARAIVRESERTRADVYLSLAHLDPRYVHDRFPQIADACRQAGLDLARDPIPIGPAAHYVMGGVVTDLDGRATLPGLFAAGEVACTGVHGANRLASNSLLEGLVFGARAGAAMRRAPVAEIASAAVNEYRVAGTFGTIAASAAAGFAPKVPATLGEIPALMWSNVGLFRDRAGLTTALERLDSIENPNHLSTVARLIARAALRREESRGAHYRLDFPERDDRGWARRIMERTSASE